jgi:SAM-dependent methyltransferase
VKAAVYEATVAQCPLYPQKRTLHCTAANVRFVPKADIHSLNVSKPEWRCRNKPPALPRSDSLFEEDLCGTFHRLKKANLFDIDPGMHIKERSCSMYAQPRMVTDLNQCRFYHAMDLPDGQFIRGNWDLRNSFEQYTGNVQFARRRVLDVGTASGFLSFEAEKRGAEEVVSFDSASPTLHVSVPFLEVRQRGGTPLDDDFEAIRNAYWYAHRAYGSRAKCYYGDVHNLPEELGEFDIVLVGAILCHLRDPLGALTSIARRCHLVSL